MQKSPALLLVAISSALVGAGVMWLLMRDNVGRGDGDAHARAVAEEQQKTRRAGIAEPDPSPPESEPVSNGAARVDPRALSDLVSPTRELDVVGLPEPGNLEDRGQVHARPSYTPARRTNTDLSQFGVWRLASAQKLAPALYDALSEALEAASPYVKDGYHVREEYWAGEMDSPRAVTHQLFRGNEYWFWAGTDNFSGIELHVYDAEGNLAESEHWQRKRAAAAHVVPANTGTYYLIISHKRNPGMENRPRMHWALAYGYR